MLVSLPLVLMLFGVVTLLFPKLEKRLCLVGVILCLAGLFLVEEGSCEVVGAYNKALGIELCILENHKDLIFTVGLLFIHFLFSSKSRPSVALFLFASVLGIFLSHDLFNIYVWFEILLVCSFVMPIFGKYSPKAIFKYSIASLIGSLTFLVGIALVYKHTGYLNLSKVSEHISYLPQLEIGLFFIFVALGLKAGLVPFHFWLGASYHKFDLDILPLFFAILTKMGVYTLAKIFSFLEAENFILLQGVGIFLSSVSLVSGFLLSYFEKNLSRSFALFAISKSGFLVLAALIARLNPMVYYLAFDAVFTYFLTYVILKEKNIHTFTGIFLMLGWLGFPVSGFFLAALWILFDTQLNGILFSFFVFHKLTAIAFIVNLAANVKTDQKLSLTDKIFAFGATILLTIRTSYALLHY
ncbi:MAG: proton-conducting transporter membrane subunit [Deltaproteobacteria bacterium]|nr:proton-conducting transporter membrane subunit [Deltaproteobacteria bacterium]